MRVSLTSQRLQLLRSRKGGFHSELGITFFTAGQGRRGGSADRSAARPEPSAGEGRSVAAQIRERPLHASAMADIISLPAPAELLSWTLSGALMGARGRIYSVKAVAREARDLSCMRAGASPGSADGRADHGCQVAACSGRPQRGVLAPGGQEDLPRHRVRQVERLLLLCAAHDILGRPASHRGVKKTYLAIVCGRQPASS